MGVNNLSVERRVVRQRKIAVGERRQDRKFPYIGSCPRIEQSPFYRIEIKRTHLREGHHNGAGSRISIAFLNKFEYSMWTDGESLSAWRNFAVHKCLYNNIALRGVYVWYICMCICYIKNIRTHPRWILVRRCCSDTRAQFVYFVWSIWVNGARRCRFVTPSFLVFLASPCRGC